MNEQKKIEELLKPRYEVIAPYPAYTGHGIEVGDILTDPGGCECVRNQNGKAVVAFDWDMFPHLFKPLPWYAKRSVEEMPEHVTWTMTERVGQVVKADFSKMADDIIILNNCQMTLSMWMPALRPATESEYTAYINSKR